MSAATGPEGNAGAGRDGTTTGDGACVLVARRGLVVIQTGTPTTATSATVTSAPILGPPIHDRRGGVAARGRSTAPGEPATASNRCIAASIAESRAAGLGGGGSGSEAERSLSLSIHNAPSAARIAWKPATGPRQ